MSFLKAEKLLSLAALTSARHRGVTIDDVRDRFGVSKRTAQRMLKALELQFPDATSSFDDEGRKRWQLQRAALKDLLSITPEELTALDVAQESLAGSASAIEAAHLLSLREKLMALVPPAQARRLEVDHEILFDSYTFVARPGPRVELNLAVAEKISEAIKSSKLLEIQYAPDGQNVTVKKVAPYGVISGFRRYLIAVPADSSDSRPKHFAIDRMKDATVSSEYFLRDPNFDIRDFAKRAFGVFQSDEEYGEVVLRFRPAAASRARAFQFHPDQKIAVDEDGSVTIRFNASGWLELTWHLYVWGDHVEVLAPDKLRAMVHPYRRSDFASLP